MKKDCIASVQAAAASIGRESLTDAELAQIESRLASTMRRLAVSEPEWQAMPRDLRISMAAETAITDIRAEASRKVENAQRQVLATAEVEQRITEQMERMGFGRTKALVDDMQQTDAYSQAVRNEYTGRLMATIEAAESGQGAGAGRRALMFLFDAQNPQMTRDLALEIFANGKGGTGNAMAARGAKAWLETIEAMRGRFNAGGGDVGKLDYGYLPQPHDVQRMRSAGAEKWSQDLLGRLDRRRYVREDGSRMTDVEVLGLLRSAYDTIVTDGLTKTEPGAFRGAGARANRGSDSRQIHFKDGDSYLDYLAEYGEGSMYDGMLGHVAGLSKDISLVERYGPNPAAQMRLQLDMAERADNGVKRVFGLRPESYWTVLSGAAAMPANPHLAQIAQHVRNVETSGKLQGAVLSSITDLGTHFVSVKFNRLPYFQSLANIGKAATGDTADYLNMHGLMAESMASNLNRWSGEHIRNNWSGRVANATMRLSLMNAWTDTLRHGFALTMMHALAKNSRKAWGDLDARDRSLLERKGFNEEEWSTLSAVPLTEHRGLQFLTPEAMHAAGVLPQTVTRFLAHITDEAQYAIVNPDLATRTVATGGGLQAGTVTGETARALAQFKSFPVAMISRHWRRMMELPGTADRLAYGGALLVSLTALGAVAFQTKQVVSGKDPVDMTTGKFWLRAAAQGGAAGFYGDLLLGDTTSDLSSQQALFRLLGPTADSVAQLFELTKGNLDEAAAGKDTHAGAESMRFARSHLPLVNLWYAKKALDGAGLAALQENLSPGYLSRMEQRARKDWDQSFWWRPSEELPGRAPSFEEMAGQ